jgi:hypothetical protein
MKGTQDHHVVSTKMLIFGPFDYVMVLYDGEPARAATKSSLLAKLPRDGRWNVT